MIRYQNVEKKFPLPEGGHFSALKHVDLSVHEGELLSLIGTSGCGKTTMIRLANAMLEPTEGKVLVGGVDVRECDKVTLRRSIGYVIQTGGLFPHMTIGRNIGLLCELEKWDKERTREQVHRLMELVNLQPERFIDRYPRELSGGQRQRVGVARALALEPEYVLMDEPFGALDPITRREVQSEFAELQRKLSKTIILVTHDLHEAFRLADRVAIMNEGEVVAVGDEQSILRSDNPFVKKFLQSFDFDA